MIHEQDDPTLDELDEIIACDRLHGAYLSPSLPGTYVYLDEMSDDDIAFNVDRMRKAADALDVHAHMLCAYHAARSERSSQPVPRDDARGHERACKRPQP